LSTTQDREDDHHRAAPDVRDEEDEAALEPVGDQPGWHGQQDVRDDAHGAEQPDQRRVAGIAVDDDEDRDDV